MNHIFIEDTDHNLHYEEHLEYYDINDENVSLDARTYWLRLFTYDDDTGDVDKTFETCYKQHMGSNGIKCSKCEKFRTKRRRVCH